MGVSTFGTFVTTIEAHLDMNTVLSAPDANLNTPFCIKYVADPEEKRALALVTTMKMSFMAIAQRLQGYSRGQLSADKTFKIFKEHGISLMTMNVQDINQVGKLLCLGPTTHTDAIQYKLAGDMVSNFLTWLATNVKTRSLPDEWSELFKQLVYNSYATTVDEFTVAALKYTDIDGIADMAQGIGNGLSASELKVNLMRADYAHLVRAIRDNLNKLRDSSEARVNMAMEDIAFIHEAYDVDLREHQKIKFMAKWMGLGERTFATYVNETKFNLYWSRCDGGFPGINTDTCSLESAHGKVIKAAGALDSVEGLGTVMGRTVDVVCQISRDMLPLSTVPTVTRKVWLHAQRLLKNGYHNLGFKMNTAMVFPSEKLLDDLPKECDDIEKKRTYIKTWANEYIYMRRNPKTYYKITQGQWDLDVLNDYMFSFWVVTPVPESHRQKKALAEAGIFFLCNCPQFNHYHYCKHSICAALWKGLTKVPVKFSTEIVGKRKAPAGASLSKRTHFLTID